MRLCNFGWGVFFCTNLYRNEKKTEIRENVEELLVEGMRAVKIVCSAKPGGIVQKNSYFYTLCCQECLFLFLLFLFFLTWYAIPNCLYMCNMQCFVLTLLCINCIQGSADEFYFISSSHWLFLTANLATCCRGALWPLTDWENCIAEPLTLQEHFPLKQSAVCLWGVRGLSILYISLWQWNWG